MTGRAGHGIDIRLTVNGRAVESRVPARMLLSDYLRGGLKLTGTHVGCEHGVCGACTVRLDGNTVRSCLMFAVQADGRVIETIEGEGTAVQLSAVQAALRDSHGLQCGFCTPGFVLTIQELIDRRGPALTEREVREGLGGNLCRCTGYQHIVEAVLAAARSAARTARSAPEGDDR